MSDIIFKELTFKNFMSYGTEINTVNFDSGMTLITGKNGEGKTSQFMALYYALFGKSYKKVKLNSLINSSTNKDMKVSISFNIDGIDYKVIRGIKPSVFEIYKDDELVNQNSTTTGYQEYLETDVLKFNENVFKQLIFLGANVNTTKSFIDLTKAEKEELFQTITDTAIFSELKDNLKIKSKLATTEKTELEYKFKVLNEVIKSEIINISKMEAQNKLILEQSDEYTVEINSKINENTLLIIKYDEGLEKIKLKKPLYDQKKLEFDNTSKEIDSIKSNNNNYNVKLSKISAVENTFSTCIGCDKLKLVSSVNLEEKDSLKLLVIDNDISLNKAKESYNNLSKELQDLTDIFNKAKQIKLMRDTKVQDNNSYQTELENIQLRKSKQVIIDAQFLKDKQAESAEINTKITNLKDIINKYDQLNKLFDNNNIKGLIIKQSLPMLNKFINEYLDHFSEFGFKFNVDATFNSSIKINNKDYEFASLSNGQSMRISFSIILAFLKLIETKNGVSTNLLVLDEILDSSLDYNGRIELLDIIKREFYNKSVFVISHNDDIINTEHFTTTLKVEKKDGFSTIQEIK